MPNTRAAVAEPLADETPTTPLLDLRLQGLLQAVRGYTPEQLLWSSGYLAGLAAARSLPRWGAVADTPPGVAASPIAPAVSAAPKRRLTILYASQTGNARSVAESLGRLAESRGIAYRVVSAADFRPRDLAKERLLLLAISTQGEGEPPESAQELHRYLFGSGAPDLSGLGYAVFGLGDSSYARFCQAGRDFDRRLEELGARRLLDRADADLDFATVAQEWSPRALDLTEAELKRESGTEARTPDSVRDAEVIPLRAAVPVRHDRDRPFRATLLENRPLTTRDSVAQVRHLVLQIDPQAMSYLPGDSLGVRFRNDPGLVERVLAATGLTGGESVALGGASLSLSEALTERLELTRVHPTVVSAWARLTGRQELQDLIGEREQLIPWCYGRQLVDLTSEHPARPGAQELVAALQPIQPRLYSIASSQAETEDEVHLTVGVLRYRQAEQERLGGASGFLTERLREGDPAEVYVSENPSFRLPPDGTTPIVLVGAGTGIAPFRAFLQHRAAQGDRGRNWLIFGNRHFRRDFLYQTDWQRFRKAGLLHRFSGAFSRDTAERVYVQDRVRSEGAELWRWLADGARLYVCGGTAMESAVREALVHIARDHGGLSQESALESVETLRRDGRYLRDTY